MARSPLPADRIAARLPELPGWQLEGSKLRRSFRFDDFVAAFAFMTRCAFTAEKLDHHPEWTNVYNRVDVVLWTHDAGGITDRDFELALAMDRASQS
jgi:4a-hydroxytetrahydrobiopterin dehydratase